MSPAERRGQYQTRLLLPLQPPAAELDSITIRSSELEDNQRWWIAPLRLIKYSGLIPVNKRQLSEASQMNFLSTVLYKSSSRGNVPVFPGPRSASIRVSVNQSTWVT